MGVSRVIEIWRCPLQPRGDRSGYRRTGRGDHMCEAKALAVCFLSLVAPKDTVQSCEVRVYASTATHSTVKPYGLL